MCRLLDVASLHWKLCQEPENQYPPYLFVLVSVRSKRDLKEKSGLGVREAERYREVATKCSFTGQGSGFFYHPSFTMGEILYQVHYRVRWFLQDVIMQLLVLQGHILVDLGSELICTRKQHSQAPPTTSNDFGGR